MNQMEVKRKRFMIISSIIMLLDILVLSGVLGEHGMGYLAGVMECFFLLLLFTVYSLPEAMAKLIRARLQKGQNKNALRVFNAAICLGIFYAVVGCLLIIICSDILLKNLFEVTYGSITFRLLAPAYVLFVFAQVYRGFFQGMGTSVPTGISKILASVIWSGAGIIFCFVLGKYGNRVSLLLHNVEFTASYSGAGVSIGFIIAELFAVLFLAFVYQSNKKNLRKGINKENFKMTERIGEITYILFMTLVPYVVCDLLGRVSVLGGMVLFQHGSAADVYGEVGVCGAFYGKYLAIIMLVVLLIRLSLVEIEGQIHVAFRKDEYKNAREWIASGTHMIMIKGSFWAVIIATLGNTIINAIYKDNAGNAGNMLMCGSTLIVFMSLGTFYLNILISQGKIKRAIVNLLCGAVVFFAYAVISTGIRHDGIEGIVIGLCINWFVVSCGCALSCAHSIKWKAEWVYLIVIPIGCASLTGIISMLLNKALVSLVGNAISVLICLVSGVFVYYMLLMALRGIRRDEFDTIPGGRFWCKIAEIMHFL